MGEFWTPLLIEQSLTILGALGFFFFAFQALRFLEK